MLLHVFYMCSTASVRLMGQQKKFKLTESVSDGLQNLKMPYMVHIIFQGNLIEDSMEFDSTCTVFELAGYVSHIGKSVEEGHYKACIKTEMVRS